MRKAIGLVGTLVLVAACSANVGGSNPDGGGTNPDGGGTNPDGGQSGTASCGTGTLFAGNPTYDGQPSDRPTSGTGILSGPPLQWQTMVFAGSHLYTRQESEVWSVDLSASSPVETKLAGSTPAGSTYDFSMGPCSSAALTQLRGLAALPDGSLVASDYWASAIVKIANPDNPSTCAVSSIAGNVGPYTAIDPSDESTYPPSGTADGQGSAATFTELGAMIADASGTIYVADKTVVGGPSTVRKIDSSGNVTTLLKLTEADGTPDSIHNFTIMNGKLYAAAGDGANVSYVFEIDTTSGAMKMIHSGDSSAWDPVDDGSDPTVSGITNDGTNLIVAGYGYVWYLGLDGKLTLVAGTGFDIDNFPSGYDPAAPHPALDLALPAALGSADENGTGSLYHLAYHDGAVYVRGHADGTAAFIEKIACP
ncbi:MAG TPA: hypothetical protein VGH28_33905 [Polyangiaceae bacterium]